MVSLCRIEQHNNKKSSGASIDKKQLIHWLQTVGKCSATDNITIKEVPYPQVNAGLDTNICYGKTATLNATTDASTFTWFPPTGLVRANTLSPTAGPQFTTSYVLTVTDDKGVQNLRAIQLL
jgi:hypothetical protein